MSCLEVCTSSERFDFARIHNKSELVSKTVKVPEMNAKWHIEVHPNDDSSDESSSDDSSSDEEEVLKTFSTISSLPVVTVSFEIQDSSIVESRQFIATINVKETSVYNDFFFKYDIRPIRTSYNKRSSEYYLTSFQSNKDSRVGVASKFSFECSIGFSFLGTEKEFNQKFPQLTWNLAVSVPNRSDIAALLNDDSFADFTIKVRGKSFKVHKCLLASASEVFKTMFTCGLDETKLNSANEDCDPAIFQHFLTFIYTHKWPEAEMPEICCDLYVLAHRYNITSLMKICLDSILAKKIDKQNALDLYEFAATYEIEKLIGPTWEFIRINLLKRKNSYVPKSVNLVRDALAKKAKLESELESMFKD